MLALGACQSFGPSPACRIDGPPERVPASVGELRLGMTKQDVERRLGPADYSPATGIYYFSTGGDCPLGDEGHQASCGVVAEFRAGSIASPDGRLSSCGWGAIAE